MTQPEAEQTTPAKAGEVAAEVPADETSLIGGEDEAESEGAEQPKAEAVQVPEKYEFKLPEGIAVDQATMDKVTPILKELGLSQEQAQKLVDFDLDRREEERKGYDSAFVKQVGGWLAEVKAHPEMGGANYNETVALVAKVRNEFLTPDERKWFRETGQGNNPIHVAIMRRIGKRISEGGVSGTLGGDAAPRVPPTNEEVLYGRTAPKP